MVELRKITKENYEECLELQLNEEQRDFVSDNARSLALAWVYKDTAYPFAVYADGKMVGFIMLGYYKERDQYTVWKFMIDRRFQRRGYGREALQKAIDYLVQKFGAEEVFLGVALKNDTAKKLYESMGFAETGLRDDFQLELKLSVQK